MTNEYNKDMRARRAQKALKRRVTYEIMHMDTLVAQVSSSGDLNKIWKSSKDIHFKQNSRAILQHSANTHGRYYILCFIT